MERDRPRLRAGRHDDRAVGETDETPEKKPEGEGAPLAEEREGKRERRKPEVAEPDENVGLVAGVGGKPEGVGGAVRRHEEP